MSFISTDYLTTNTVLP